MNFIQMFILSCCISIVLSCYAKQDKSNGPDRLEDDIEELTGRDKREAHLGQIIGSILGGLGGGGHGGGYGGHGGGYGGHGGGFGGGHHGGYGGHQGGYNNYG